MVDSIPPTKLSHSAPPHLFQPNRETPHRGTAFLPAACRQPAYPAVPLAGHLRQGLLFLFFILVALTVVLAVQLIGERHRARELAGSDRPSVLAETCAR